jgi:hypothetical protein
LAGGVITAAAMAVKAIEHFGYTYAWMRFGGFSTMSAELVILDELLTDDLPLSIVRRWFFDDDGRFRRAIAAMLDAGELRLLTAEGADIPRWQWREVLGNSVDAELWQKTHLSITALGAQKV